MIIKDIKLDDNVIMAVDEDNKELLKFNINIGGVSFMFTPPTYLQHQQFIKEYIKLINYIANIFPNTLIPTLGEMKEDTKFFDWKKVSNKIFVDNRVIKGLEKCLINYLNYKSDLKFNFLSKYRTKKYLRKHCTIFDFQKLFAFICVIDELIKKNYTFQLINILNINLSSPKHSSLSGSGKSTAGQAEMFIMPRF